MRDTLFGAECNQGVCQLVDRVYVAAELMEHRCPVQGKGQAVRMRPCTDHGQRRADAVKGLVGIAKHPQRQAHKGKTIHLGISPIPKGMGAMLLGGQLISIGFLAELFTSYYGNVRDTYSIKQTLKPDSSRPSGSAPPDCEVGAASGESDDSDPAEASGPS